MRKLIATQDDRQLFQTGYFVIYEGTAAEQIFASGVIVDANDEYEVNNIESLLTKHEWNIVAPLEQEVDKARERRFSSRSEAGRYAAQVRWGNRNSESTGIASNGVPLEPTFDVNEAILTGRPYAPFLEENMPPELVELASTTGDYIDDIVVARLTAYYLSHMNPADYSPEVMERIVALTDEHKGRTALPNLYYKDIRYGQTGAAIIAEQMAMEFIRKKTVEKLQKGTESEMLQATKDFQKSPDKAVTIAVPHGLLPKISKSGEIQNQFAVGDSGGFLNLKQRAGHEAIAYATHPATVPEKRPIYGVYHPLGVQSTTAVRAWQYGDVQLVLKPEVHKRTTFSLTDSLGMVRESSPVQGPITKAQASPFANLRTAKGEFHPDHPVERLKGIREGLAGEYAESQIHGGGVKVSDVSYIAWTRPVPKNGELKPLPRSVSAFAKRHGIKVVIIEPSKTAARGYGIVNENSPTLAKSLTDVIDEIRYAMEKGRPRKFSTRSEAAQYAARIRWGTTNAPSNLPPHMQKMRAEAEAVRAEMDALDAIASSQGPLKEITLEEGLALTDVVAFIDIDSGELTPTRKAAEVFDRMSALGMQMEGEARLRAVQEIKQLSETTPYISSYQSASIYKKHYLTVVSEVRDTGGEVKELRFSDATIANIPSLEKAFVTTSINDVRQKLPTDWNKHLNETVGDIQLTGKPDGQGSWSPLRQRITAGAGSGIGSGYTEALFAHEFTHAIETARPSLRVMESAFLLNRTTTKLSRGTLAPKLKDARAIRVNREPRQAIAYGGMSMSLMRDEFVSMYSGRIYANRQTKSIGGHFFEVTSTSIQQLFQGNRDNFDSEHIGFGLGVLATI